MDSTTRAIIGSPLSRNAKFLLLGLIFLSSENQGEYSLPDAFIEHLAKMAEYENMQHLVVAMDKLIRRGHIAWIIEGHSFQLGNTIAGSIK